MAVGFFAKSQVQTREKKTTSKICTDLYWYEVICPIRFHKGSLTLDQACDSILKSVEVSLTSFQRDLGAVSAEIETLQSRSTALNTKLENRKVVEKILGPAVEEISIAPAVVKKISDGPIDLTWVRALEELEKRSKVIEGKMKRLDNVLALADVKPLLDDLTNRVRNRFIHCLGQGMLIHFSGCRTNT
jgi:hypothetical protein